MSANDAVLGVPSNLWMDRAKRAAFEVAYAIGERDVHHRVTTLSQVVSLLLVVVEAFQLLGLAITPQFGYSSGVVEAAQALSIKHALLGEDWSSFAWGYGVVAALVWITFSLLFYIHSSLSAGALTRSWPLVVLRALLAAVFNVGFVPVAHVLLTPLSCSEMHATHVNDMECHDSRHILVVVCSVLTMFPYVVVALSLKLLVHESDPNAVDVLSKTSGYGEALSAMAALVTIAASLIAHRLPTLMALLTGAAFIYVTVWACLHLPYYHSGMNTLYSCVFALMSFLCAGAMISTAMGNSHSFSNAWLACFVLALGVGIMGPRLQNRRIRKRLAGLRPQMLKELAIHHGLQPCEEDAPSTPDQKAAIKLKQRRASIVKLADRAQDTRFRTAELPLGQDEDDVFDAKFDPDMDNSTPFEGMAAYEVELLVRAELARPGNTDTRKRRRRFGRSTGAVPTTEAVEHVVYIFAAAMDEFAEDAVDIAQVKIEYARFLQVYTADVNLATGALEGALRERPTLEGSFQVFTRMRRLQKKRQTQNTDAERTMNEVVKIEYTKRLRHALHAHGKALEHMDKLLRTVNRHRGSTQFDSDSMAERLGAIVEQMAAASKTADTRYRRLMITNANAPGLNSVYRRFCRDVLKNDEAAAQVLSSGDDRHSSDGQSVGTGSVGSANTSSTTMAAQMRTYVPRKSSADVAAMDRRFQIGTAVLLLVAAGMFIATHTFVNESDDHLATMQIVNDLRASVVQAGDGARTAGLLRSAGIILPPSASAGLARALAGIKARLLEAFYGVMDDNVETLWDADNLPAREYIANDQWFTTPMNLFYITSILISDTLYFTANPTNYHDNKQFRFLFDNGATLGVTGFEGVVTAINQTFHDRVTTFWWIQVAYFVVLICTLVVLGVFVFGRALNKVQAINRGVVEIASHIPPLTMARMRRDVQRAITFVRRARIKAEAALNDGADDDGDRGVGDVKGFTYDADVEAAPAWGSAKAPYGMSTRMQRRGMPSLDEAKPSGEHFDDDSEDDVKFDAKAGSGELDEALAASGEDVDDGASPRSRSNSAQLPSTVPAVGGLMSPRATATPPLAPGSPAPGAVSPRLPAMGLSPRAPLSNEAEWMADAPDDINSTDAASMGVVSTSSLDNCSDTKAAPPSSARRSSVEAVCPPDIGSAGGDEKPAAVAAPVAPTAAAPQAKAAYPTPKQDTPLDARAIIAACPSAVVCMDSTGTILFMNDEFCSLTGYTMEESVGQNISMLQAPDLDLDAGDGQSTPRLVGQPGRQLEIITKGGNPRPAILSLGRLDFEGTRYYVGSLADISMDTKTDAEQHEEEDQAQGRSNLFRVLKVCCALLLVALLQGAAMLHASSGLQTSAMRANEVNNAARLRKHAGLMKFACREAAIGDGELWTAQEASQVMRDNMKEMSRIRFGLRYGDDELDLEGSLGRDPKQDALQLNAVEVNGELVQGLDTLMGFLERDVDRCIRKYEAGDSSVGPNYFAVATQPEWLAVEARYDTTFQDMLSESENLYAAEATDHGETLLLFNRLVSAFNCIILLFLYLFVFRVMVRGLLSQAKRTEHFLYIIPNELGAAGPLKKFFQRAA